MSHCPRPVLRNISAGAGSTARPMFVACGECASCRLTQRNEAVAQAAMEGLHTREKFGAGHVWMVTPTLSSEHLSYHEPVAHSLQEWLSVLKPREDSRARSLEGPDRALHQQDRMRQLYGMSDEEIRRYRCGDYSRVPELNRRPVALWFMQMRKAGMTFRKFEAGEYGGKGGRPHWHILLFGLTQEEFVSALRLWRWGFTDPSPDTWTGRMGIEKQIEQNARPGAAAKYAAKYMTKDGRRKHTAETFARKHEYVERRARPALGLPWAQEHLAPVARSLFERGLDDYWRLGEEGPLLAAYAAHRRSGFARIDGWHYPLSRSFRDKVLDAAGIEEELRKGAGRLAVEIEQERAALVLGEAEHGRMFAEELARLEERELVRETRYAEEQRRREKDWKRAEAA